jgi:hypothetical protein
MKPVAIALAIAAFTIPSHAETYSAGEVNALAFEIRSDETESDTLLRAACIWGGRIDIRFGATYGIGKGRREAVSAKISAGKTAAKLKGVSVDSPDSELTGGTELLTSLPFDDPAFAILTQSGPVTIEAAGIKADRFTLGPEATTALKAFLAKCKDLGV